MVAVISSGNLGVYTNNGSNQKTPGLGGSGTSPDRIYINATTGNLVVQQQDEWLNARGIDLSLIRTYNAQGGWDGDNGDNWRIGVYRRLHSLTGAINTVGSTITKTFGDGAEVVYTFNGSVYVASDGDDAHDTLSYNGSTSQWTWTEGTSRIAEVYSATGQVLRTVDVDGNATSYTYTGSLLTRIDSPLGTGGQVQQTFLDYSAGGTNLQQIRVVANGVTQIRTQYFYDTQNRLNQVVVDLDLIGTPTTTTLVDSPTDSDTFWDTINGVTYVTAYTYDGTSNRIASITQGDGTFVAFTYEPNSNRVSTYTEGTVGGGARTTTMTYTTGASGTPLPLVVTALPSTLTSPVLGWSGANSTLVENAATAIAEPIVKFDANGNGFALWRESSNLKVRRFNRDGAWTGTTVITLDLASNTAAITDPMLTVDSSGNAIATWIQNDGSADTGSVWVSMFTVASGAWTTAAKLDVETSVAGLMPYGVINASGQAAVIWRQGTASATTTYDVKVKRFTAGAWQTVETLDSQPASVTQQPYIAIDNAGKMLAVWMQNDGANNSVYTSQFTGSSWSAASATQVETGTVAINDPSVAFDAAGNGFVLWRESSNLRVRRFNSSGGFTGTPTTLLDLAANSNAITAPRLYVNSNGYAIATWIQTDSGPPSDPGSVWASMYTGSSWSTAVKVDGGNVAAQMPFASINSSGQAVVVWRQPDDTTTTPFNIRANRFINGAWEGAQLLDNRADNVTQPPYAAIDSGGNILTAWMQSDGSANSLYINAYQNDATPYFTIPGTPATPTWSSIALAVYGRNDAPVVTALQNQVQAIYGGVLPSLAVGKQIRLPVSLMYGTQATTQYAQTDIRDALNNTTRRLQDSQGRLLSVITPDNVETRYAYDSEGNISSIIEDATGIARTTTFIYDIANVDTTKRGNLLTTRDSLGNTITRTYNGANQLLTETRYVVPDPDGPGAGVPTVPLTTRYVYDSEQHLRFTISPEGRVTEFRYSSTTTATQPDGALIETLTYHDKLYTAALFAESDLTAWLSPTGRDLSLTQYVSYDYDFRGNLTTTSAYAGANASTGVGTGTPSITRYVYDQRGLLLSKIDPRGESTPADPNDFKTTYIYDGMNRLLSTTEWLATGVTRTTTTAFDDVGNKIVTTLNNLVDSVNRNLVTTSAFNRAGDLMSVVSAGATSGVLGTVSYVYDAAGRLRYTQNLNGVRQHFIYDTSDRKVADVDGDGTMTEYVYNSTNQVVKSIRYAVRVDPLTIADSAGNLIASTTLTSLRSVADTNSAQNFVSRSVYDGAGRLVYGIDALGAVTQFYYDGANRITTTTKYANAVSIDRTINELRPVVTELTFGTTATSRSFTNAVGGAVVGTLALDANNDQRTRNFYDNDGNLIGTLDAEGYATENKYDAAGLLIKQIGYATKVLAQYLDALTFAGLNLQTDTTVTDPSPERDAETYFFYDGQGRKVGVLDAEGALTESVYNVGGLLTDRIQYGRHTATNIDRGALSYVANDTLQTIKARLPSDAVNHTTSYFYDGAKRLVTEVNYEGSSTVYKYDSADNVLSITTSQGTTDERVVQSRYDELGHVIAELSAQNSARIPVGASQATIDAVWNQFATKYTYDKSGRRTSKTVIAQYDTTSVSLITYYFYNSDGQLTYTVNAQGQVDRTLYDAHGRVSGTIGYAKPLTSAQLITLQSQVSSAQNGADTVLTSLGFIAATAKDNSTTTSYQFFTSGAERSEVLTSTVTGGETKLRYNALGQLVRQLTRLAHTGTTTFTTTRDVEYTYAYSRRNELKNTAWDPSGINRVEARSYDAFGRVSSITDSYGRQIKTQYDRLGRVLVTIDASNIYRRTEYDAFSRVLKVYGAYDNPATYQTDVIPTTYTYSDSLRSVVITTPEGVQLTTVHTRNGQTLSVTDGRPVGQANTTTYSYNKDGQLTQVVDSFNAMPIEQRAYDSAGREMVAFDGNGNFTRFSYDAVNRLLTRTVDLGAGNPALTTTYSYDDENRVMSVTDTAGTVTRTEYDVSGRVSNSIVDYGTGRLNLTTHYDYDDTNNIIQVTDGIDSDPATLSRITQIEFDKLGRRTKETVLMQGTAPQNLVTEYRYDRSGNVTRKIDARGNSTWFIYDSNNRQTHIIDALGGVTATIYDKESRVIATRRYATAITSTQLAALASIDVPTLAQITLSPLASDRVEQTVYDRDGRAKYSIDSLGGVTERTFDQNNKVIRTRFYATPIAVTEATPSIYKIYGDVSAVGAALSSVTTALTNVGNSVTTLSAADRVEWCAYDLRGRKAISIDGLKGVTRYEYDLADQIIGVTQYAMLLNGSIPDAITGLSANNLSLTAMVGTTPTPLAVTATPSQDRVTTTWYDKAGRARFVLDAEGYLTETRYDDVNRSTTQTIYAQQNIVTSASTFAQVVSAVAVPAVATNQKNQPTTTQRDAAGRITSVTDALGRTEYYGYDAVGNKTSFTNKRGSALGDAAYTWRYYYDANNRLTDEVTPQVNVTFIQDNGAASPLSDSASSGLRSITTHITYDELGNVQTRIEAYLTSQERTTRYEYDKLGRQTKTYYPDTYVYTGADTNFTATRTGFETLRAYPTNPLFTQVFYNTLGDAVANLDIGGVYSYKTYDRLGRVEFEVAELHNPSNQIIEYVTEYAYDTFGNKLKVIRHEKPLTAAMSVGNDSAFVRSHLNGDTSQSRVVTTTYDRLNRATQVVTGTAVDEPMAGVVNYDPSATPGTLATTFNANPTTFYKYNAFGDVIREARLQNKNNNEVVDPEENAGANKWAYTFYFYDDRRGLKTAEVNAEGYLTTYSYNDETGQLTGVKEHARKLAGFDAASAIAPAPTPPAVGDAATGFNREVTYDYDQLNRKTWETRVDVHSSNSDGSDAPSQNVTTQFGYDYLGNLVTQTLNGATTYTYYDALGRITGIIEPARNRGDGSTLRPLTVMYRDAYGNLVKQTQYSCGTGAPPDWSTNPALAPTQANPAFDRTTRLLLDRYGHVLRTDDAEGNSRFASYNPWGKVAREWQTVTNPNDNSSGTVVTIYKYDDLGNQVATIEPRIVGTSNVEITRTAAYNAFGEVVSKTLLSSTGNPIEFDTEYFVYDRAGRVIRTNSGDGVYKVYAYNLDGKTTAKIQSRFGAVIDLSTATAETALTAANADKVMRTESLYDRLGRVTESRQPTFGASAGIAGSIQNIIIDLRADGSFYLNWSPPSPDPTLTVDVKIDGVSVPQSSIVTFADEFPHEVRRGVAIAGFAVGSHTYSITYQRSGDTVPIAATSGTFMRNPPSTSLQPIAVLTAFITVAETTVTSTQETVSWSIDASIDRSYVEVFIGGAWQRFDGVIQSSGSGSLYKATISALSGPSYQYRIIASKDGVVRASASGTLNFSPEVHTPVTTLTITPESSDAGSFIGSISVLNERTLTWTGGLDGTESGYELVAKIVLTQGATTLTFNDGVDIAHLDSPGTRTFFFNVPANLGAGTWTYTVYHMRDGENVGEATGTINSTGQYPVRTVSNASATPIAAVSVSNVNASLSGGATTFTWTASSDPLVSATLEIRKQGTSTWTSVNASHNGSSFSAPPVNTPTDVYDYQITQKRNGLAEVIATGTLNVTAGSSSTTTAVGSLSQDAWNAVTGVSASIISVVQVSSGYSSASPIMQSVPDGEGGTIDEPAWSGPNTINLSWDDVGNQAITVEYSYRSADTPSGAGVDVAPITVGYSAGVANTGAVIQWYSSTPNDGTWGVGGISRINYVKVYDATGRLIRYSGATMSKTRLIWNAPSAGYAAKVFDTTGGSYFQPITATNDGAGHFYADLPVLFNGTYGFEIDQYVPVGGESATNVSHFTGQVVVSGSSASIINQSATPPCLTTVNLVGDQYMRWNAALTGGSISVIIKNAVSGAIVATPTAVNTGGSGYSVDLTGLQSGNQTLNYTYEIRYNNGGTYLLGTGRFAITTSVNVVNPQATPSAPTNTTYTTFPVTSSTNSATISWNYPTGGVPTIVTVTVNGVAQSPTYSGPGSYTFTTDGTNLAPKYTITYRRVNDNQVYAQVNGTFSYSASTSVHDTVIGVNSQTSIYPSTGIIATPTHLGYGVMYFSDNATVPGSYVRVHYRVDSGNNRNDSLTNTNWSGWFNATPHPSGTGFTFDFSVLPDNTKYEYEVQYLVAGQNPYLGGKGFVTIAHSDSVTPGQLDFGAPSNAGTITPFVDLNNGLLGWGPQASAGNQVTFNFKLPGDPNWATPPRVPVYDAALGYYKVDLSDLTGTYVFEVEYLSGGTPYRIGSGQIAILHGSISGSVQSRISATPTPVTPSESQQLDRWGNVLLKIDAATNQTSYQYNQFDAVTLVTHANVDVVSVTPESSSNPRTVGTTLHTTVTSANFYDKIGNLIATRDGNGNFNKATYNEVGQVIGELHADGGTKQMVFDVFGQIVQTTDEANYRTRNVYDRLGHLKTLGQEVYRSYVGGAIVEGFASEDPTDVSMSSATVAGHPYSVVVKKYVYDSAGRLASQTNGEFMHDMTNGQETSQEQTQRFWYDLHGNLIRSRSAMGIDTNYDYDSQDRKRSEQVVGMPFAMTWTYDYFGRLRVHHDLDDHAHGYSYDATSGLLSSHTSNSGVNQSFQYDDAGHLTYTTDAGSLVDRVTEYRYDNAGRQSRERIVERSIAIQDSRSEFDTMGRIAKISGYGYSVQYSYDAAGNRTHIDAHFATLPNSRDFQDLWYQYDSMNRVTISQGVNNGGHIELDLTPATAGDESGYTQGIILQYNTRGQRISEKTFGSRPERDMGNVWTSTEGLVETRYGYDGLGRLTDSSIETLVWDENGPPEGSTEFKPIESRVYDRASRVVKQVTEQLEGSAFGSREETSIYTDDGLVIDQTTKHNGALESNVHYGVGNYYGNPSFQSGYDAAGMVKHYFVTSYGAQTQTSEHLFNYLGFDSYKEETHTVKTPGFFDGHTTRQYNANGELISFTDDKAPATSKTRWFLNNAKGEVVVAIQGDYPDQALADAQLQNGVSGVDFFNSRRMGYYFYLSDGSAIGSVTNLDSSLTPNFDVNFERISPTYPASVPSSYVVQAGDNLRIIAAKVFGDAKLWYLIAQANGLADPSQTLTEGRVLSIPNNVVSMSNDSTSFKPFDMRDALADTTPTQPAIPPPHHGGGCGTLGMIILIIVVIIVCIYTAGAAAGALSGVGTGVGTGATVGTTLTTGLGVVSGTAVATGTITLGTALTAAAIGGAVGALAGQFVGNLMGIQDGFDWKGIALGAVSSAFGAGLGAAASGAGAVGQFASKSPYLFAAANAATTSVVTQGVAVAIGAQDRFEWKQVAAAAIAAPAAKFVGGAIGSQFSSEAASQFADRFSSGIVGGVIQSTITNGKVDFKNIAADAFGNAVGNAIVDAIKWRPKLEEVLVTGTKRQGDEESPGNVAATKKFEQMVQDVEKDPELAPGNRVKRSGSGPQLSSDEKANSVADEQQTADLGSTDSQTTRTTSNGTEGKASEESVRGSSANTGYKASRGYGDKGWTTVIDEDGHERKIRAKDAGDYDPFADREFANKKLEEVSKSQLRAHELAQERARTKLKPQTEVNMDVSLWKDEIWKSDSSVNLFFDDPDLVRLNSHSELSASSAISKDGLAVKLKSETMSELQFARRSFDFEDIGKGDVAVRSVVELGGSGSLDLSWKKAGFEGSVKAEAVAFQANAKFETAKVNLFGGLVSASASGEGALNALAIGGSGAIAAGYDDGRFRFRLKASASVLFGAKLDIALNVDAKPLIQHVSTVVSQTTQNAIKATQTATAIARQLYKWWN